MVTMDDLPENVLLYMFSCLDKQTLCLGVRLVCKQWCRIAEDPTLWRKYVTPRHFTDSRFKLFLQQKGQHTEILDCNKCEVLSDTIFFDIDPNTTKFINMKKVVLPIPINYYTGNDDVVSDTEEENDPKSMVTYMKHLSALFPNLQDISNIKTNMRHTVDVLECQRYFPNLTVIHDKPISSYGRLGHMSLTLNAKKKELWIENLEKLSKQCPRIECYKCMRGMHYVDDTGLEKIASLFPNLNRLDLHMCSVSDTAISHFIRSNKRESIEYLYLNSPGSVTEEGFLQLIEHCSKLNRLALVKCPTLTNSGMMEITSKCPDLRELILDNSISGIDTRTLPQETEQITDDCVIEIAKQCPRLRMIKISKSSAITWRGIQALCTMCPSLGHISIVRCSNITDHVFSALLTLKQLKYLHLQSVTVTPKGIVDFILLSPHLLHFVFYHNGPAFYEDVSDLMDKTYELLESDEKKYRPSVLQSLTVSGVGGAFLWLLTVLCPRLSSIDLRDKTTLSTFHFESLLKNCELLSKIDISSTQIMLDSTCFQAIAKFGKNLRKLSFGTSLNSVNCSYFSNMIKQCKLLCMIWFTLSKPTPDWFNLEYMTDVIKEGRGDCCVIDTSKHMTENDVTDTYSVSFHFTPSIYMNKD